MKIVKLSERLRERGCGVQSFPVYDSMGVQLDIEIEIEIDIKQAVISEIEQLERDAELGALVRRMKPGQDLEYWEKFGNQWRKMLCAKR